MKTVVISGGNGGLGRALADRLEHDGWHCVLLDINIDGLQNTPQRTPIAVDLTDTSALERAVAGIIAARPSIDMVIYNAGVTQIEPFDQADRAGHRRLFDINYFASVELARAFLHPLRQSQGVHLAMSSVAGFAPVVRRTSYAASKHAMQGFFGCLRSEEAPFGVHCLIAAPSFVATNVNNPAATDKGILRPGSASDGVDFMTAEDAARIILRGVAKRREFIPVGRVAWLSSMLMRLSPALYQRAMRRNIRESKG